MPAINSFDFRSTTAHVRFASLKATTTGAVLMRKRFAVCLMLWFAMCCPVLRAQTAAPAAISPNNTNLAPVDAARVAKLEQQIADARMAGDNAWMLTSAALVLMMTGPGLALFYGGLVRKKNVLATMMQSLAMMAVITVLWALLSYSLAFGPGSGFIGGLQNVFMHGVC